MPENPRLPPLLVLDPHGNPVFHRDAQGVSHLGAPALLDGYTVARMRFNYEQLRKIEAKRKSGKESGE